MFSAAVAQLLGSSLQNLQSNPQNASAFYLGHIYQLTPGSNVSSIPFDDPTTFEPPTSAIWVSTLWSLSLVVSLTCALLATLLQQWARRYLHITQKRNDPQKRAQTRELMSQALDKPIRLSWMIELLPFLLHTSVFLFLAGFVAYLFSFNNLVAELVGACAGTSLLSYMYVSIAPIYSRDSPYSTPLTTLVWAITMAIISLLHRLRYFFALHSRSRPEDMDSIQESFQFYYQRMLKGTTKDVERLADKPTSRLATSVLLSTFESLDGDSDIEQFLSCIPGFYASASAKAHSHEATLDRFNSHILPRSIISFIEHVLSSDLLSSPEKEATVTTCLKAIKADTRLLESTFQETLQTPDSVIFTLPDFVRLAARQLPRVVADTEPAVKDYAHCVVAVAINRTQLDDNTWVDISLRYLEPWHAQYRWDTQNLRLCNLICLTQYLKTFQLEASDQFREGQDWHRALVEARKLEVTGIAPGLRNEFLRLWDELDNVAHDPLRYPRDQMRRNATDVLTLLLAVYTNLRAQP